MKKLKLIMIVITIICLSNTQKSSALSPNATSSKASIESSSSWKLCYESDNIFIYERWIKKSKDDSTRERKGSMIANCSVAKATQSITNYETQKNWMRNVEDSKLLKRKSDTSWITYTLFDLPWPLDNRDIISEYHVKQIKTDDHVQVNINSLNNYIKENKEASRINNYRASWTIKKISNSKVSIVFSASGGPKQVAPARIIDPIMHRTFQKNLLNLRVMLE